METTMNQTSIYHKSLTAAVKAAQQFAGRGKRTIDRWKSAGVTTHNGALLVETGDGETFCRLSIPTDTPNDETGGVQLDETAAAFLVKSGLNHFSADGERVTIGGATFPVFDGSWEGFDNWFTPSGENQCAVVPWSAWEGAATAAVPATDYESSRYALGCVRVEIASGRAAWVGTDGRRLHYLSTPADGGGANLLIHAGVFARVVKAVETIGRAIVGAGGRKLRDRLNRTSLTITTNGTSLAIVWSMDGATLSVATQECQGRFPRWRDVFPNRPCELVATFNAEALRGEIVAAARVTTEQTKGVVFDSRGESATISAGKGESTYRAPLHSAGEPVPAGFYIKLDPRFLFEAIDAGKVAPGYGVSVAVTDYQSAAIIRRGAGEKATGDETGFAACIMPLAIDR